MAVCCIRPNFLVLVRGNIRGIIGFSIRGFREFLMDVKHVSCLPVEGDDKANQPVIDVGEAHGRALLIEVVDDVVGKGVSYVLSPNRSYHGGHRRTPPRESALGSLSKGKLLSQRGGGPSRSATHVRLVENSPRTLEDQSGSTGTRVTGKALFHAQRKRALFLFLSFA
jgi:hypothetical protein